MTDTTAQPTPTWIRPDGSLLPAPEGLGPALAGGEGDPRTPDEALAIGWVGANPVGGDAWWEIAHPSVATTRRAHDATALLVRRKGEATPKPLAGALARLRRNSWDSDRYADAGAALAALRSGMLATRLYDAVDAALDRMAADALEPDLARVEAAQATLLDAVADLHDTAHAWRYGPALRRPPDGRWSEDPDALRAGARAAAGRILGSVARMESALADSRLAVLGLVPGDVPAPPPVEVVSGETAPAALLRLLREREADVDRAIATKAHRGGPTDALPPHLRPSATLWTNALAGTSYAVSNLRALAETFLTREPRSDPGDAWALRDLASHLISHECGRTALELRHRIRSTLPAYLDRLREAVSLGAGPADGASP